ncbi:hypothetical protein C8J57DRAFT_1470074 [Mycena rebaudengoi]|nr:hypothetical protein C8J57DRAFT_1470074 [Mycena rebaudengoi]
MNYIQTTLRWTGILLALALKCKDKRQTMQAFRCFGQFFSVQGDNETALSLFNFALDGFTFMDIHRWRADCMVRIADILNNRGEAMKAVELWKAARPLFERSSQTKDILKIDGKLAEVDSAVLADALEEAYITEEEEEEDKLAQGSDVGDKGKPGILLHPYLDKYIPTSSWFEYFEISTQFNSVLRGV